MARKAKQAAKRTTKAKRTRKPARSSTPRREIDKGEFMSEIEEFGRPKKRNELPDH